MMVKIDQVAAFGIVAALSLSEDDRALMAQWSMLSTRLWRGTIRGETACVFGLIPPTLLSNQAYIWLYHTPLVEQHKFLFVRHSQILIEDMLKEFPTLVGHVDPSQRKSVRWLKWLGAVLGPPQGKMVPFTIRRKDG